MKFVKESLAIVIKMNIDTDLQFAFTEGSRDYILKNQAYLKTQIGNPEGADIPNKKYYDLENGCVRRNNISQETRAMFF